MPCQKRPVAKLQTLVKNLPELLKITLGLTGNIHQIHGTDALIKPAVKLKRILIVFVYG